MKPLVDATRARSSAVALDRPEGCRALEIIEWDPKYSQLIEDIADVGLSGLTAYSAAG
jgi:hypothetical protein